MPKSTTQRFKRACLMMGMVALLGGQGLSASAASRSHPAERHKPNPNIVIVAIDDQSLKEMGPFPWVRSTYVSLLKNLFQYQIRGIGLDISFRTASEFPEADQQLRQALKTYKNATVVCSVLSDDYYDEQEPPSLFRNLWPSSKIKTGIAEGLFLSDSNHGFCDLPPEKKQLDTRIRLKSPIGQAHIEPKYEYTFELVLLNLIAPAQFKSLLSEGTPQLRYHLHGPKGTYPQIPFYRVLQLDSSTGQETFKKAFGQTPADYFKHKIILVGATTELLWDQEDTELGMMSGVEVKANILDSLLDEP